jgi:hypothetical protein
VDDRLRQFAVNEALKDSDVTPRGEQPRFEGDPQPKEGAGLDYEFTIPVLPEVKIPDYSDWTVDVPRVELNDELRQRYALQLVGSAKDIRQRFFAISVERKIKNPAVAAICELARKKIFA